MAHVKERRFRVCTEAPGFALPSVKGRDASTCVCMQQAFALTPV